MSYCRMTKDSDAYMYPHVDGYIECMGCKLNGGKDRYFYYRSAALLHMQRHKEAGHKIPLYAIKGLQKEMSEEGNKI